MVGVRWSRGDRFGKRPLWVFKGGVGRRGGGKIKAAQKAGGGEEERVKGIQLSKSANFLFIRPMFLQEVFNLNFRRIFKKR